MTSQDDGLRGFDVSIPHPARMFDAYLGGKDNFAADRAAADKVAEKVPTVAEAAKNIRRFLARSVKHVAGQGTGQFIDIGTGFPTSGKDMPNVHQVVKDANPAARVLYVDNDPVVVTHNAALREDERNGVVTRFGDLRDPRGILAGAAAHGMDFSRPACVVLSAVLHFITDQEDPYGAVSALRDALAPGSYVIISHITQDSTPPGMVQRIEEVYSKASAPAVFRDRRAIGRFFTGLTPVDPGIAFIEEWLVRDMTARGVSYPRVIGGVGRKA